MTNKEINFGIVDMESVTYIHDKMLEKYGGLPGVRDENALGSAIQRPQMQAYYNPDCDVFQAAAAAGYGLIRSHPFNDANKRTGCVVTLGVLRSNGYDMSKDVSHDRLIGLFLDVAAGKMEEEDFASFLRQNSKPMPTRQYLEETAILKEKLLQDLAGR